MICMGEAGMKRVLFKIIVPALILGLWMLMCYPVCQQENGFDYFLFWIMVGFPYGIRKMCMFLIWEKYMLTVDEAVQYFGIGEKKIRMLISENADSDYCFTVQVGNKSLINRRKFEEFLNQTTAL